MAIRLLIGSANEKHGKQLGKFLVEQGYRVLGITNDSYELLRKVHTVYPDFVIIDGNMKGMKGNELCEVIVNERLCPVVALISSGEFSGFVNLEQEAIFKCIQKPLRKQEFLNTIDILYKTFLNIKELENKVKVLNTKINDQSIVEKAKKLLMDKLELTEEEAHRKIQKESMDKGIPKIKTAKMFMIMYGD